MAVKCGLGFFPTSGVAYTGALDQTAKLDRYGTYSSTGNKLGTRSVCWRLYGSGDDLKNGQLAGTSSLWYKAHHSGHVLILSIGAPSTFLSTDARKKKGITPNQPTGTASWWNQAATTTTYDSFYDTLFSQIELGWSFGAPVGLVSIAGSSEYVPGCEYGGQTPTEVVISIMGHEPNIPATQFGPAQDYARATKKMMQRYDSWCSSHGVSTKHIKFCPILSMPSTTSLDNYWDRGGTYDITAGGARSADMVGTDVYYPFTENSGNGPVGTDNVVNFNASGKFPRVKTWADSYMPNKFHVIGEFAFRIPTKVGFRNDNWPATMFAQMNTYLEANKINGGVDHCIKYACQYAAGGLTSNTVNGGIDNSIVPDQNTYDASFQKGGVSLRPAFEAFRTQLLAWGNPTLVGGVDGVNPTGVTFVPPAAGATSATISYTLNSADRSYNVYKNGVKSQSGVTANSVTVTATSGVGLPQTHKFRITGTGTNGKESDFATATELTITFTASGGTVPSTPTGLAVGNSSITQTSAVATCNVPTPAPTGYMWFLDGNTDLNNPDFNTTSPQVVIQGKSSLTPGSAHSVKVTAYNAAGTQTTLSGSVAFTLALNQDSTPPPTPVPSLGAVAFNSVFFTWPAVTDPSVVGEVQSGLRNYVVARGPSPTPDNTITIIATPGTNSYTDANPVTDPQQTKRSYYFFAAVDNQGNQSPWSVGVAADVPSPPTTTNPIADFTWSPTDPSLSLVGLPITFDASISRKGSGGDIIAYAWAWGDGIINPGDASPQKQHIFNSDAQYKVTLTVTDSGGHTNSITKVVPIYPTVGSVFQFTGATRFLKGQSIEAAAVNSVLADFDAAIGSNSGRDDFQDSQLNQISMPISPSARWGGAVYFSVSPSSLKDFWQLTANQAYVWRCWTQPGKPITSIKWHQVRGTITSPSNTFFALYDFNGLLLSPSTVSSADSAWGATTGPGERTYIFDGGPYIGPFGADADLDDPTYQFFVYMWIGGAGTTPAQMSAGTGYSTTMNLGVNNAIDPSAASSPDMVPVYGVPANTPAAALTPPATLGVVTPASSTLGSLVMGLF